MAFQEVIKLLLIINLIQSISGLNDDVQLRFNSNAKRNADKAAVTSNKISKLRLILLSDLKPNEIVRMSSRYVERKWMWQISCDLVSQAFFGVIDCIKIYV